MEINKENNNKRRLGRGLGSLLGGAAQVEPQEESFMVQNLSSAGPTKVAATETAKQPLAAPPQAPQTAALTDENRVWQIAVDKLVPGVYQPRKNFDRESLNELAASIKENGIIQPITVRKRKEGGFEILAGERRWRAAQAAGLHEVPAIIKSISDREALQLALIENVQREDLDPIEEAESYQRLAEEFSLSQQEVAEKVGKERSTVANSMRLLGLPPEIRDMLSKKQISAGHAKAILSLTDKAKQVALAQKAAQGGLSVRALEGEVKAGASKAKTSASTASLGQVDLAGRLAAELADQLQKSLGTKVEINYRSGKGSVQLHFYSDDQLTALYEKLKS